MTRYYIDLKEYAETADISEVSNETIKEVIKDFLLEAQNRALTIPDVIKSVCTCENSEKEKDSLVPVYCNNCNAYVQTDDIPNVADSCRCSRCGEQHHECLNGKMCYVCDNVTQGN